VDVELRPLRRPECRGFRPLQADGFAHHPYSQYTAPDAISQNPDHVTMGDLDRLSLVLAALHERGRLARRLPIYITEYGYETNPPDPRRGIPLERQALYMSQAASMALGRADVRMFAQFQLRDLPQDGLYQTGLLLPDGRSKPSLFSFRLPFWVEAGLAWGQVRPERGRQRVVIERLHADGSWRPVTGELSTEADGVFRRRLGGAGTYRLRWERPDGGREWSLPVTARS
jgi:hypothetical protein